MQARSKTASIDGLRDGRLKIRLIAPPVDSKANQALTTLLAEQFTVSAKQVDIVRGAASRDKVINIDSPRSIPDWFLTLGGCGASIC